MKPVRVVEGRMVPLDKADVDTDQIMPKQFLKRVDRTGFGDVVFHDWCADPDFVLNDPDYAGAKVLVTGPNFGAGSSREHAPWGLQQYGFQALVAPGFADIFRTNCTKIGLLTVAVSADKCARLLAVAGSRPETVVRIDLAAQQVTCGELRTTFEIDPHAKHMLLDGLDEIDLALRSVAAIERYERGRPAWHPLVGVGEGAGRHRE